MLTSSQLSAVQRICSPVPCLFSTSPQRCQEIQPTKTKQKAGVSLCGHWVSSESLLFENYFLEKDLGIYFLTTSTYKRLSSSFSLDSVNSPSGTIKLPVLLSDTSTTFSEVLYFFHEPFVLYKRVHCWDEALHITRPFCNQEELSS